MDITLLLGGAASFVVGFLVSNVVRNVKAKKQRNSAEKEARRIKNDAERSAEKIVKKANQTSDSMIRSAKDKAENERRDAKRDIQQLEKRLADKEMAISNRDEQSQHKQQVLEEKIDSAKELRVKQEEIISELFLHLEKVSQMSRKEAEEILMANVEKYSRDRAGRMIKDIEEKARQIANRKATEIVLKAIQKVGVETVTGSTTSSVTLPDDEMKGRIIGKEGRNIRAFENITGVDVIIDDTPNAVILSCFDPIRREYAKMSMTQLVQDGRVNPTRVEESIEKAKKELDDVMRERGEAAADEVGMQFHPKIIELFGRLSYRTSYGQNMLSHAIEAVQIAENIALALGVNVQLAKRGTMLHDIGKAVDFEQEGSHDDLGAEICRKYGESEELINCIMAHHEDEEPDTVEAVIVMVADALSSARPGARKESVELYIKRLEKLEAIAKSFEGVEKAFAIQAGREIRVIVQPDQITDDSMYKIAQDIAKRVETEVDYPGEVKVSLVRETRSSAVAK